MFILSDVVAFIFVRSYVNMMKYKAPTLLVTVQQKQKKSDIYMYMIDLDF